MRGAGMYGILKLLNLVFSVFYNISPPNLATFLTDGLSSCANDFDLFAKKDSVQKGNGLLSSL